MPTMRLARTFILLMSLVCEGLAHSAVIDDGDSLVIPAGETYTLGGTHSYAGFIQIDGTLYVDEYVSGVSSGKLELSAPAITISGSGKIIADGKGYPSGYGPGRGAAGMWSAGGASYGGRGGGEALPAYGALLNPWELGSGGGYKVDTSSYPGGAGGGAIRLTATGDVAVEGAISANGDPGNTGGAGAGGAINITAGNLTGGGTISANGGYGYNYHSGGGGGRIFVAGSAGSFHGTISAYGGESSYASPGGPGSVLLNTVLSFDNRGVLGRTNISDASYSAAEVSKISIKAGALLDFSTRAVLQASLEVAAATVAVNDTLAIGSVTVGTGGVLGPLHNRIELDVKGTMSVAAGGMVFADGKGYPSGYGPGKGKDGTYGGGGSYGGQGGGSDSPPYGSLINPIDFGSGGGYQISDSSYPGGAGGGFIRLAVSGDLAVDGLVSASGDTGNNYYGGGGSGGGINLTSGKLSGAGLIRANGGYGYSYNSGGGGGRIAAYYGQKSFTGNISATGGASTWGLYGDNGSIVDNGAIVSGGKLGPGESITTPFQTIGSERTITEGIQEQIVSFDNLAASGTFSGTVSLPQLMLVRLASGEYSGKGFAKGAVNAVLDGKSYAGSFKGAAILQGSTVSIRGLVTGDIYGSAELSLTEAALGSGIYNRVSGLLNCNRIGDNVLAKVYLAGEGVYVSGQNYPAVKLGLTQTAVQGTMTGDYAGPFNAIFTGLTINDNTNPHNGEGYSLAAYSTAKGEASGWAYAQRLGDGIMNISGLLDSPLYALAQGIFNSSVEPRRFLLNTEKLDNSLLALKVKVSHPYGVSPGGTYSFGVTIDNQGTKTFEDMSVVVVPSPHMAFVSASSTYTLHSSVYWTEDKYDPIPCIRWDFTQIAPGQAISLSYALKARIGVMANGEIMKGNVYILPRSEALDFLPGYDYDGPLDDDVIEDGDLPSGGGEIIIRGSGY